MNQRTDRRGCATLCSLLTLASALCFDPLVAATAVIGVQEASQLAPEDIKPGRLTVAGAVVGFNRDSFTLEFESSWGTFTYRVERIGRYQREESAASESEPDFDALFSSSVRQVRLNGVIDSVEEFGAILSGVFEFSNARVRLRFTLEKRVPKQDLANPSRRNIVYGPHWRQTIDLYSSEHREAQPLLVYIHGGGWIGGDKTDVGRIDVSRYLRAGISVASVNYRRVIDAAAAGVDPPVQCPMHDVARAIQTLRNRAESLGLDRKRFAVSGASAGGCSALWVAFHDEMARQESEDEIARESTRVVCAAVFAAQTSLDPRQLREWVPEIAYGGHAFGFLPRDDKPESFQRFLDNRDRLLPEIERYSPFALASSDDPELLLLYDEEHDATHSPLMGAALKQRMDQLDVPCEWAVVPRSKVNDALATFVISALTQAPAE